LNNNRTWPLLLALACSSVAAQETSSVTLFGRIDLAVRVTSGNSTVSGPGGLTAPSRKQLVNGSRSRWGIRVDEALSGGWKAHVFLDSTINADTGTAAPSYWDGRSTIGLSHPEFGRIDLGRIDKPTLYLTLDFDPWQGDTMGQAGNWSFLRINPTGAPNPAGLPTAPADFYSFKSNNSITYASPRLHGWQARVQVAAAEGTEAKASQSYTLTYRNGPLHAGAGHQYWNAQHHSTPLGVWYDLGFVKPMLSYVSGKRIGNKESNILLGATAPLGGGEARVLWERYTYGNGDKHDRKWAVGYFYPLSKRTTLYTNYADARFDDGTDRSGYEFGVKHSF
jgi:predicted porin